MEFNRNKLSLAVRTGLTVGAVLALGVAGSVQAQDQATPPAQDQAASQPQANQATTLQTVVVTGSHIRRVDLETSNPVITVSAAQIQATGKLTLGDVVQNLPAITGGLLTPTVNNHNAPGAEPAGRTLVGLRGLGSDRTLLLVDGQRVLNTDLNSIPAAAVERIEVLTDGASAVYGSDAIGGVINVILKSNYQGAQVTTNYGISTHGDGEKRGGSFVFGQSGDKGSLLAGLSYNKMDIVLQGDRKFSHNALSLTSSSNPTGPLTTVISGSGTGVYGTIRLPASIGAKFGCNGTHLAANHSAVTGSDAPLGAGDFHCFGNSDRYNYAAVQALDAPQERLNAFFKGTYHLTDHVDAYMTTYFNKSTSSLQLAPNLYGVSTNHPISAQSYYNPFGIDFTGANGNSVGFREVAGGNRVSSASQQTSQLQTGLKGSLQVMDKDWTWDAGINYGYYTLTSSSTGSPSGALLAAGTGPSFLNSAGVVQCGTPSAPISLDSCVPWNPFNGEAPSTVAALKAANTATLTQQWTLQRQFHVDVSGGLVDLPAGTMQLAAGLNYRNQFTNSTIPFEQLIDPATGNCPGAGCAAFLRGSDSVKEAYSELFIPLLQDQPFAKSLNVTLGDRYSKYDLGVGSTNNWKVAFEWRPINDLLLRGTVATVFRAPSIQDIFGLPAGSTSSLSADPCDGATKANPACQYVPLDGTFRNSTVAEHGQGGGLFSGSKYLNFPLKPEQGKTFDFGAVYSPSYVPGLSLSLDYWRINLNDTITIPGEQTVLDLCYNGLSAYCPLIQRFPGGGSVGQLNRVFLPTTNLGSLAVKGTDFSSSYRLPDFGFGQFTAFANVTYMTKYEVQIAPGTAANQVFQGAGVMAGLGSGLQSACPDNIGGLCFFPRWTLQGGANWQLGNWDASWHLRVIDKFNMGSKDLSQASTAYPGRPGVVLHYGTRAYNDLSLGYMIKPINTKIDVGVNNVMDKQPPLLYANNSLNANTDPADFDVLGRYYWARVTVSF